tara:strand:- start:676 stop:2898 length:2223 start_codon:yes stop_codon:yes gene_type:complete
MANVIKLKRGSGSDPSTSDLVVGEVAVRTDNGKLFTKKDNGSIAEISGSGGANEISINTLSSSSGSGGGSASFNGSATRFTLSNPPSVSAQQLLVSVNGVIQKPNSGTSPSEGFAIDGNDILFASAPATGSDFFILTYSSLSVGVPSDNSVTSAKITDLTIVNGDISNTAAIAGSKISPDFGSQNIVTTGRLLIGTTTEGGVNADDLTIANTGHAGITIRSGTDSVGSLYFSDGTSGDDEFRGAVQYNHTSNFLRFYSDAAERLRIDSSGRLLVGHSTGNGYPQLSVSGNTAGASGAGMLFLRRGLDRATIGSNVGADLGEIDFGDLDGNIYASIQAKTDAATGSNDFPGRLILATTADGGSSPTERMRIDSSGKVGIDLTPSTKLDVKLTAFAATGDDDASDWGANGIFQLNHSGSTAANNEVLLLGTTSGGVGQIASGIGFGRESTSNWGTYLSFKTHSTSTSNIDELKEYMRINSSGNVGIGHDSPGQLLSLKAASGQCQQSLTSATDQSCAIYFGDTSSVNRSVIIHRNSSDSLAFNTAATERMRINSSGNLTVGTTNDNNGGSSNTDDGVVLQKVGHVISRMDGGGGVNSTGFTAKGLHTGGYTAFRTMSAQTQVGGITFNSGGTSFNTSSDYRRKENIIDLTGAITRIKTLIPKRFNFIDEPEVTRDGFLAHEVTTVPEAIWGEKDAVEPEDNEENEIKKGDPIYQQLDQSKLVPLLVAALQEAIVRIEALEAG